MQAKKIIPKLLIIAFVIGFGVLCAFNGDVTNPVGTLWSLFPPVVAIGLALLTKDRLGYHRRLNFCRFGHSGYIYILSAPRCCCCFA